MAVYAAGRGSVKKRRGEKNRKKGKRNRKTEKKTEKKTETGEKEMRRMKRSGRKAEILVTVTAAVLLGAVLLLTGCAAREGGAIHPIALEAVQALTARKGGPHA